MRPRPVSKMTDTLSVKVNKRSYEVPNTVSTVSEFLDHTPYTSRYRLYRIDGADHIGPLGEMLVFDEGDEFVALPKYINGG